MLQYLVILLDDTSTSYCHYENTRTERKLIPLADLRAGILFAMKENLAIQFVYPDYELPEAYREAINSIDHSRIVPSALTAPETERPEVVVLNGWDDLEQRTASPAPSQPDTETAYVLRTSKADFLARYGILKAALFHVARLNVVLTDVADFTEADFEAYRTALAALAADVEPLYAKGRRPQLNLLTDRMMLTGMNNCNAGWKSLTLAPNGKFYICPAFYLENEADSVGSPTDGPNVKNPQLYRLDHAPLCRRCDAYQCKRCVWLNRRVTLEVNTPGHEQCVAAHLERNAARLLLQNIRKHGAFLPTQGDIKEIAYLDPFEVREEW